MTWAPRLTREWTVAERMNETTKFNRIELIARFAKAGTNDPSIAARLGVSVSMVRRLRKEAGISPGETRWLSHRNPLNTRYTDETEADTAEVAK